MNNIVRRERKVELVIRITGVTLKLGLNRCIEP
jgi:hypothetical protein